MGSKKRWFIGVLYVCLMLSALSISCQKQENSGSEAKKPLNIYSGRDIKPVYSRSEVKNPHTSYEFEPALQGDIVKHDFIIKNDAMAPLELSDVEGCCGCFVESHTRKIPPGESGAISALLLTDSRGGEVIDGTIRAQTNDPNRPEITIDVLMEVKEFADLNPYRIWLKGSVDEEIVEKCIVIPNEDYPFNITDIKNRAPGGWIDYSYKEIEKNGRKAYEITVKNTKETPGAYQDVLFVQTDHNARPEFKIRVEGRISE
ncbi:MAG TPA: DUF1573 domain-containing protein [Desulfosalsimonadaceae bacterium]|nr:DUF1573 domain-containing protein [Desulfosalsimonadaceae bacterium]